jgi:predicted PurR-regulated permease PerM
MPGPAGQTAATRRVILTPGLAAVVLTVLALLLVGNIAELLLLLFLAILLAIFLDAFTDAVVARTQWKRPLAFGAAILATLLVLWGIEALLVPPVIAQTRALAAGLPRYVAAWQDWLGRLVVRFPALEPFVGGERQQEVVDAVMAQAESLVTGLFPQVFNLLHGFINVVSVAVMALYLARQPRVYLDFVVALIPPRHRGVARETLAALGATLKAWVFAQLFNMFVLGLLTALGLWALDVPSWLAFGIFSGLAAIVPFFGVLLATILPALFVLDHGVTQALLVILLGTVVHVIEGNFIGPLVFQRGVHLPPVLTIMSVLIVGSLLGPVGLLVAVPMLAVSLVLVRKILIEQVYQDPPEPIPGVTPDHLPSQPPP